MEDAVYIPLPFEYKGIEINKVDTVDYTISTYNSKPHRVLMLDISTDRKWITYLTETYSDDKEASKNEENALLDEAKSKKHYLTVRSFDETHLPSKSCSISLDVTELIKFNETDRYNCISISRDGRRVALSYYFTQFRWGLNDSCFVFEFADSYMQLSKIKDVSSNGRAVFLDNGQLVLQYFGYWAVTNENYKIIYEVDLRKDDLQLYTLSYLSRSSLELPPIEERQLDETIEGDTAIKTVNNVIYTSRLTKKNVILTTSFKSNQIWSLLDRGCLLASIEAEVQDNIFTFSSNMQFFATYSNLTALYAIYNVKSSLKTSQFKSQVALKESEEFIVTDAHFYNEDKYLVVAGILTEKGSLKTLATFEVWHIESEISIYYVSKEVNIGKRENRTIYPFIFEEPYSGGSSDESTVHENGKDMTETVSVASNSKNKAADQHAGITGINGKNVSEVRKKPGRLLGFYTTRFENGDIASDVLELDIFQEIHVEEYENFFEWKNAITSKGDSSDSGWHRLKEPVNFCLDKTDVELTGFKAICFARRIDEDHLCYLRFDSNTVQMWQLSLASFHGKSGIVESDKLLFVYAYKAPLNAKFDPAPSYRIDFQEVGQAIPCLSFVNSSNETSRILVNTTMKSGTSVHTYYTEELFFPSNPLKWAEEKTETHSKLEHQYLKGACQAFMYYTEVSKQGNLPEASKNDVQQIIKKIKFNIKGLINTLKKRNSLYFTSMSGSKILFLLTAFKEGHEIIYQILRTDQLPVNVYPGGRLINDDGTLDNNNSLTALIDKKNYNLYNLLLNRMLLYAKSQGVGGLSVITDALIRLQDNQQREILLSSCRKISYLCVENSPLPVASGEIIEQRYFLDNRNLSNFRNLDTFSCVESLPTLRETGIRPFINFLSDVTVIIFRTLKDFLLRLGPAIAASSPKPLKYICNGIYNLVQHEIRSYFPTVPADFVKLCVVPLVQFNSYYVYPEDRDTEDINLPVKHNLLDRMTRIKEKMFGKQSVFIRTASNIADNSIFNEGDTVLEIMLQHKWKQFAHFRFVIVCCVYLLFYITYSVGVSFAEKSFGYVLGSPITDKGQLACICLMFISAFVLLFQEGHQFKRARGKINYILSPYNWVDLAAIVLPTIMFVAMIENHAYFDELNSFTALILWLHGILRMRVWRFIGISLETIIQLSLTVKEILLIMVLIICAFTNAFLVLLAHKEDAYFQENYGGSVTIAGQDTPSPITFSDTTAGNPFGDIFKSFAAVWFFIYGVWDPVTGGDAGDNNVIIVLLIVFSLVAVLIFFNLVIVYMSSKIEEIMSVGTKAWIRHFASVVAEIEELWCLPHERHDRKRHPSFIFYYAHMDNIEEQEEILENDTEELIQKLDNIYKHVDEEEEKQEEDNLQMIVAEPATYSSAKKSYKDIELHYSAKLVEHIKKSNELIIEKLNISDLNPNQDLNQLKRDIQKLSSLMQDELVHLDQVFNES